MTVPWWKQPANAGVLENEIAGLEAMSGKVTRKTDAFAQGVAWLLFEGTIAGRAWRLEIVYPDNYPWFRPEFIASDESFDHHQNPYAKNLCLMERTAGAWDPSWNAARLLDERLADLLATATAAPPTTAALEVPQAEPLGEFLAYNRQAVVFVESGYTLPPYVTHGMFTLRGGFQMTEDGIVLRAELKEVRGADGQRLSTSSRSWPVLRGEMQGAWLKVAERPEKNDAQGFLRLARQSDVPNNRRARFTQGNESWDVEVWGFVLPSETGPRTSGVEWAFAYEGQPHSGDRNQNKRTREKRRK
ncbi:MAG TPA: hypothetical protein VF624_15885 [Tepidisphaeraceae bacterium]|jgi:ubiquitin-protein ligase